MRNWIGVFGVMGVIFIDNGGEFSLDEMREVMFIFNVCICIIVGMSFFQNGLCERVYVIIDSMLIKLEEEYGKKDC